MNLGCYVKFSAGHRGPSVKVDDDEEPAPEVVRPSGQQGYAQATVRLRSLFKIISQPSSPSKSVEAPALVVTMESYDASPSPSTTFENPFSGTPISSSSSPVDNLAVQALFFEDSSAVPLDYLLSPVATMVEARFDIFGGAKESFDHPNFNVSSSLPDPLSSLEFEMKSMPKKLFSGDSIDRVVEKDLIKEPGQTSTLLIPGDELIVQSLTHMASSGSQSKMTEENVEPSSPIHGIAECPPSLHGMEH
ncbi:hypothetical protein HAX54_037209 [Datura stramonium]|uniref:Uncharacterized protein n=1 Tax=Datura stramonium TaxID=4076 RepID=A0ABS8VJ99_DATST|nr:hypothetical protein [Datura stramonium]